MDDNKFVSGEEFNALKAKKPHSNNKLNNKIILVAIGTIIYSAIIFYLGIAYQKHHLKTPIANTSNSAQPGGRFGGFGGGNFANRTFGSVTAISSTSITIQNSRTNSTTTLTINSSTQITENQQTISASSISVGENVIIGLDASNKTIASSIMVVNFPNNSGGSSSSTSDSQL